MNVMKSSLCFLLTLAALLLVVPAGAQEACTCDNTDGSLCSGQGFRISLVNYEIDQIAGESLWDYEVCNETGLGTGCDAPKDLSHVDLDLPGLGSCLGENQAIQLSQVGGIENAFLSCGVSPKDPSCDIFGAPGTDFVAKCDVESPTNLDPGECVVIRLTIAGETPALGAGAAMTVTKAGPECVSNCILGPSCEACSNPGEGQCLTRTAGFWSTHPQVADLFLPIEVCGDPILVTDAGNCNSTSEAMCVSPGRESRGNTAYAQLVRQLTAAKLNLAATAANGGACSAGGIEARIAQCETLCNANQKTISNSGCIEDLDTFNNSQDTFGSTPAPFDRPGPADPSSCQAAKDNGLLFGKGLCDLEE